ncbi:hypothetical protein Sjap_009291 [Stephania japonica]|uniref:Uncharacterized protein n=1 Tax=Stephania japonica TaxID=461633 RepID=A0AAP0PC53_9MAGN
MGSDCDSCCKNDPSKKNDEDVEEEFKDLINERELLLHEWTLRKGVQDMKRWIEKNKSVNPHAAFKGSLQFSKARRNWLRSQTDFLLVRGYRSIDELYGYIEQLYIDMLNEHLVQLPNAIFKEIIESHAEEYEEKVKFALKVLCKMEQLLEDLVQWSFPSGTAISHLMPEEDHQFSFPVMTSDRSVVSESSIGSTHNT